MLRCVVRFVGVEALRERLAKAERRQHEEALEEAYQANWHDSSFAVE